MPREGQRLERVRRSIPRRRPNQVRRHTRDRRQNSARRRRSRRLASSTQPPHDDRARLRPPDLSVELIQRQGVWVEQERASLVGAGPAESDSKLLYVVSSELRERLCNFFTIG
jgi:hypothetical protein